MIFTSLLAARYSAPGLPFAERTDAVIKLVNILVGADPGAPRDGVGARIKSFIGDAAKSFVPKGGMANPHVRDALGSDFEEFLSLRGSDNPKRFLELNLKYSMFNYPGHGRWDSRQLSLLRNYEYDRHLLLRTIVRLQCDGKLLPTDRVLIVGPRHLNEMVFFKNYLGLVNTVRLDLIGDPEAGAVGGDMHNMPFDSGQFKFVFSCSPLTYAHDGRKVYSEIARVCKRPGYVAIIDSVDRVAGADALGWSDFGSLEAATSGFFQFGAEVVCQDSGRVLAPNIYRAQPCYCARFI